MNVARFDFGKVVPEHLRHRRTRNIGALLRQPAVGKVAPRVLGVRHVDIRNDIHNAAVGFLGQTLVLATVARFHVVNRNLHAFRHNSGNGGIGVAEN